MGCGAAQAYRCVLWEDLLGNIHLPHFVHELFPHRWDAAIATAHVSSHQLPAMGLTALGWDGCTHTARLLGKQPSSTMQQQAEAVVSSAAFTVSDTPFWLRTVLGSRLAKRGSGRYCGVEYNPFILLTPYIVTYGRCKPALLGQRHMWEVWYKKEMIRLLFPQAFLNYITSSPGNQVHPDKVTMHNGIFWHLPHHFGLQTHIKQTNKQKPS